MSGGSARLSCIRLWKSEDPLRSRFSNRLRRKFPLRFTAAEIYLLTRILETAAVFKIYGRERRANAAGLVGEGADCRRAESETAGSLKIP